MDFKDRGRVAFCKTMNHLCPSAQGDFTSCTGVTPVVSVVKLKAGMLGCKGGWLGEEHKNADSVRGVDFASVANYWFGMES